MKHYVSIIFSTFFYKQVLQKKPTLLARNKNIKPIVFTQVFAILQIKKSF